MTNLENLLIGKKVHVVVRSNSKKYGELFYKGTFEEVQPFGDERIIVLKDCSYWPDSSQLEEDHIKSDIEGIKLKDIISIGLHKD